MTNQTPEPAKPSVWSPDQGLRLARLVGAEAVLDPALNQDLDTAFLIRQIFRGLVSLDTSLTPVPELAESIEVLDQGAGYRFRLRSQASFHDGTPILAEHIQRSLLRALSPVAVGVSDASSLAAARFLADIEGADAVLAGSSAQLSGVTVGDERTVEIRLSAPSATFLMRLASEAGAIVDTEQTRSADWWLTPNGSGPFRVSSYVPGETLSLVPFEGWWAGKPSLASVDVRLGFSASQPINLYQAGEIDLVDGVAAGQAALLNDPASGFDAGQETVTPLFALGYLAFTNRVPPLDDPHLRRALGLVFPVDRVVNGKFNGAVVPAGGILPDGMLGVNWASDALRGDPEKARRELQRSRYGSAASVPPIRIHAADTTLADALAEIAARELGLTIEVIHVDWPDFLAGLEARLFPAYSLYWGADYPDPESLLAMLFATDSPSNFTGYTNPGVDSLLAKARSAVDLETRIALYRDAQQRLVDDGAVIPVYFDVVHAFTRRGLGGLAFTPMGLLGLENAIQTP